MSILYSNENDIAMVSNDEEIAYFSFDNLYIQKAHIEIAKLESSLFEQIC